MGHNKQGHFSVLYSMRCRFTWQGGLWRGSRAGQAMTEYVVVAGMLLASLAILMVFFGTFREYGTRVLDLLGSEYP